MARRHGSTSVFACCCAFVLGLLLFGSSAKAQNGACCDINGNCVITDQCTCILQGGGWQGNGSVCNPGFTCPPAGACCTPNGCVTVDPTLCANIGGTFFAGNTCPIAACPPQQTGACCCRLVICLDTTVDLCTFLNGQFIPNSTCVNTNPCLGACCGPAPSQCVMLQQSQCNQPGQQWIGGSTCNPNPCVPPGFVSCCLNGMCVTASYCDCVFKNGIPFPPGTTCTASNCFQQPVGACCTGNGICVQTNATVCSQYLNGTSFVVGGPCPSTPCPNVQGHACCCMGSCYVTDPVMCQLAQGTTQMGSTCNPTPCTGACCDPATGNCFAPVSQQQCQNAAGMPGIYLPGVFSCQPNPCTGACCDPATGNCFQAIPAQCPVPPFQFFGIGSLCTPNICPLPTGACCDTVTGNCTIISGMQCPSPTEIFMGVNTTCNPNPCMVCCDPATGNCTPTGSSGVPGCLPNEIQIPGISCVPNPCPPMLGACCTPNGCIPNVTATQCLAPNLWLGPGSVCTPNKCPGACCDPQTGFCVYTGVSACPFPVFIPLTSCTPTNPCPQPPPTGACCDLQTGICNTVAQTACPTTTSIWLGPGSSCTPNPCVVCCDPSTGNCFPIPAGTTTCPPGSNTVVGTSCAPNNPCPPPTPSGACCFTNGLCLVVPVTQCPAPNVYLGNGTACTPASCRVCCNPQTGACFPPIVIFGQAICWNGAILQVGTTCTPNPCPPPGACCRPNGTCFQATQANCVSPNVWVGAGTTCTPGRCVRCCLNGVCYTPFVFLGTWACIAAPGQSSSVVFTPFCTPNPCPPPVGACCLGQQYGCPPMGNICITTTQANCLAQGGMWKGANVPCQSPPGNFTACCKANFNGSGGVTVQDLFSFLIAWFGQFGQSGPNPPLTADFNCDGTVTVQDLFDFLIAWFAKCF